MAIGDPTELDFVPVVTRQNREFFGGVPTELGVCTCKYRFVPTELGDIFTYPTELGENRPRPDKTGFLPSGVPTESYLPL